jgi:abortive infection bacteriophage resistance protein
MRTEVGHFFLGPYIIAMPIKPALPVSDQINLLQQRGMRIESPAFAEAFLLQNNYYRLNIYFHKCMRTENQFIDGITFEDIVTIYQFDRWLRNRLLMLLEPIEIHMKTRIAYHLGRTYGSDCFYKSGCFKDAEGFKKVISDFENERSRNFKDPVIIHHETTYSGRYPIWVIVEFLSFKAISNIYSCMHERDKKQVAQASFGINEYYLGQWLHSFSVLRNICAHYGYLFKREFSVRPKLFREFGWDQNKNGSLFAMCLVLRRLSDQMDWSKFIRSLQEREKNLGKFSLKDYGFPTDWQRYLLK